MQDLQKSISNKPYISLTTRFKQTLRALRNACKSISALQPLNYFSAGKTREEEVNGRWQGCGVRTWVEVERFVSTGDKMGREEEKIGRVVVF